MPIVGGDKEYNLGETMWGAGAAQKMGTIETDMKRVIVIKPGHTVVFVGALRKAVR